MGRQTPYSSDHGFSLVEMLVAMVFTMVLMAGMATVFKSSLTTFYAAGEKLSSVRRNRSAMDLLFDDLNSAGMFLTDLSAPPSDVAAANPAFYILPNQPIANATADGPQTADELYFYFDQPLDFEGTLVSTGGATGVARTASQLVLGQAAQTDSDNTYTVECGDASYAEHIAVGQQFIFKDFFEALYVKTATQGDGVLLPKSQVVVVVDKGPTSTITGSGSTGAPAKAQHIIAAGGQPGSGIVFYLRAQMVRYSIQMRNLDPASANSVPCLVRDQGNYSAAGFVANQPQQIISENVPGFKAYLSADSGQSWAGFGQGYSGFSDGWTNGIQAELNTQLSTTGRIDNTTTAGDPNWFRSIPALVRLDITTRTAMKRSEYSTDPIAKPTDYKQLTQSLVIVPRHFGLTMK